MAEPKRLSSGRWKVRYRDPLGRPRSKVCDTKGEARAYIEEIGHAARHREWIAPELGRMLLADWVEMYMSTVVHLRPTTVNLYQREFEHILRRFGQTQLIQLEPLAIQAWLAELMAGEMAASSVHRKYRLLRRTLQVAVEKGVIAKNACNSVQPPRVELNEMRFLIPEQAVALAEAIDPWYRTFVYTALETGMRWSELVGLRRSGVNLLHRSIAVTEQLVFIAGDKTTGRERRWVRQRPKTRAGVRSITISRFLAERLQEQLAERSQPGQDGLVFTNQRGNAISGSIFNKRHWQAARATVGVPDLRFHDLRHTAVALAIAQGAHPKAIQRRMGHSTINMTLDRYGHLLPELDEQIANDLDGVLRLAYSAQRTQGTVSKLSQADAE
jgi:integrase